MPTEPLRWYQRLGFSFRWRVWIPLLLTFAAAAVFAHDEGLKFMFGWFGGFAAARFAVTWHAD